MSSLLLPHEWLAVCLLLALGGGFACFSWNHYSQSLPIPIDHAWLAQEEAKQQQIEVIVEGAVRHPGAYHLPRGSRLGALLDQAELLAEADVRHLRRSQKLRDGQHVQVLERPMITIYLTGAVERVGAHQVRAGTPLSALPDVCPLQAQAERKGLKGKRHLVDEEHIHVPFKSV